MKHVQQIIIHYLFLLTKLQENVYTLAKIKKLHLSHGILLLNNKSSLSFQLIFNHLGCLFQERTPFPSTEGWTDKMKSTLTLT